MEITSGYLSANTMEAQLDYIESFLKKHSTDAMYMYGIGCNVELDEQWKTIKIQLSEVKATVFKNIQDGLISFCESDFYIYDGDEKYNFLLCHECDIHFESKSDELVASVKNDWENMGFEVKEIKRKGT